LGIKKIVGKVESYNLLKIHGFSEIFWLIRKLRIIDKIVRREEMNAGTLVLNETEAPVIARIAKPGQIVILKSKAADY
jgi:hypothetical protein